MTQEQAEVLATKMLAGNPEYLEDTLRLAPIGNSVVGSLLSLQGMPRQYAEQAALAAAKRLKGKQDESR